MHPNKYALMAMPENSGEYLDSFMKIINPHIKFYMPEKTKDEIAPPHISLVYFSYPEKYTKDYIKTLFRKLKT